MSDSNNPIRKLLPPQLADQDGTLFDTVLILNVTEDESFEKDFRCVVCLYPPVSTNAVMACLHRFCSECFNKCLRKKIRNGSLKGQNECPICRVKLSSRRDGRPDKNFDELVKILTKRPKNIPTGEYIHISSNFYVDEIASPWMHNNATASTSDEEQELTTKDEVDFELEKAKYEEQKGKMRKRQEEFKQSSAYETFAQRSPLGCQSPRKEEGGGGGGGGSVTPLPFGSVGFSLHPISNTSCQVINEHSFACFIYFSFIFMCM